MQVVSAPCVGGLHQALVAQADWSLKIPAAGTNLCLDNRFNGDADNNAVQIWECNGKCRNNRTKDTKGTKWGHR